MDYYTYNIGKIILASSTALTNLLIKNNVSYSPLTSFIYNYSTTTVTGIVANNLIFNGTVFDTMPSGGVSVTGNILSTDP
jgi:hypothetical protein